MKKFKIAVILTALIVCLYAWYLPYVYPATSITSNVTASVSSTCSFENYNDANVLFTDSIPFTNIDPENQYNYPDGRGENDGKSDIGFVIIANNNKTWYFKIKATDVTGDLAAKGKIFVYMGQPINRNTGGSSDGTLGQPKEWLPIPTTYHTLYTSAGADNNNAPYGTLITLSFRVDGSGLKVGPYVTNITYTMTDAP